MGTFTYCTGTLELAPLTAKLVAPGPTSLARPPQRAPAPGAIEANGAYAHARREPEGQPSSAITSGADRILTLIEGEKAALTATYAVGLRALEADLAELKFKGARAVAAAEARAREAEREAAALRTEHARLLAGIEAVGMVYSVADRALRFAPATARIVEDFVLGARMQEEQMREMHGAGGVGWVGSDSDGALFEPVGPAQFFGVLGSVLEKGRAYAEAIEQHQQNESATAAAAASPSTATTSGSTTGVKRPPSPTLDSPTIKHRRT